MGVSTVDDHDPCHDGICQFPRAQAWFCSLLPTSAEGFSFIGVLCSAGLYQLWCCLTVSDPDLAGFQSIIKECVCELPAAQNEPSVVVVNGKGHLSSRLCWLATKTESIRGEGQTNLKDRPGGWTEMLVAL